jgi:hypothetical protein
LSDEMVSCPLLNREISVGYCFDLCNIATDDILFPRDKGKVSDWDKAQIVCDKCGRYNN